MDGIYELETFYHLPINPSHFLGLDTHENNVVYTEIYNIDNLPMDKKFIDILFGVFDEFDENPESFAEKVKQEMNFDIDTSKDMDNIAVDLFKEFINMGVIKSKFNSGIVTDDGAYFDPEIGFGWWYPKEIVLDILKSGAPLQRAWGCVDIDEGVNKINDDKYNREILKYIEEHLQK